MHEKDYQSVLSREDASHHLWKLKGALTAGRLGRMPTPGEVIWPQGLDRSIIETLPLKVRTRNCLLSAGLTQGRDQLTAYDMMQISNAGKVSVFDLLFTLETFLLDHTNKPIQSSHKFSRLDHAISDKHKETDEHGLKPENEIIRQRLEMELASASWKQIKDVIQPVLATAAELGLLKNLTDVFSEEFLHIADVLDLHETIESTDLQEIAANEIGLASEIGSRLNHVLDKMSERELQVLRGRILEEPPQTLEEVGKFFDVTRERIRQIQARIAKQIDSALRGKIGLLSKLVKDRLGHVITDEDLTRKLQKMFPNENEVTVNVIKKFLVSSTGYTRDQGHFYDEATKQLIDSIRDSLKKNIDDAGLIAESELLELLNGVEWKGHLPWLVKQCGLHEMYGFLAIRDSAKARTKAALLSIGRPATRREIMQVCGFGETEIGAHLSNITSVIRADKDRWGIRDWIDDEYDGIVGEIIQRINEDGGTTTSDRLLSEIPAKFNVSPISVKAYLDTPRFDVNEGHVRLASHTSLELRHLDDVVDGYSESGEPYWKFRVEKRHFTGYSVTGVPPEFLKALGCQPDGAMQVRLDDPELSHHHLSARWPLATTTGGSIGYATVPLKALEVMPGDYVQILIKGIGLVGLRKDSKTIGEVKNSGSDSIIERMKNRRRVL